MRLLQAGRLLPGRVPVPLEFLVARPFSIASGASMAITRARSSTPRFVPPRAEAAKVPLLESETEWKEVQDYSARTGAELLLGAFCGAERCRDHDRKAGADQLHSSYTAK